MVQGIATEWFRSCLVDRKQKVEMKSSSNTQTGEFPKV
jgi:hypothetical protein